MHSVAVLMLLLLRSLLSVNSEDRSTGESARPKRPQMCRHCRCRIARELAPALAGMRKMLLSRRLAHSHAGAYGWC